MVSSNRFDFRPLTAIFVLAPHLASCGGPQPAPPPRLPQVTVTMPVQRDVTVYNYFTGRTAAFESAEIRARVPGFLEEMHFDVASDVKVGDILFTIEKDAYQAKQEQMKAALESARAQLKRAQADLERVEIAVQTNAVSKQEVGLRQADRDVRQAAVLAAEADLRQAELDLSYCDVRSPIDGQVSRNLVDVGNLVGSGENTLLATVARMDPIYVYFDASEADVLRWLEMGGAAKSSKDPAKDLHPAFLGLADGEDYQFEGVLDYIDNTVDPGTGTINVRARIPNPDDKLFPGLFSRVRVPFGIRENGVLVEEKALGTDLGGKYVLTVDDQNVVQLQHVTLGPLEEGMRMILTGLEAGQRYIVDGLLRARPGMPCEPMMRSDADESGAPSGS